MSERVFILAHNTSIPQYYKATHTEISVRTDVTDVSLITYPSYIASISLQQQSTI